MSAEWYCNLAGSETGPLTPKQVRQLAAEGWLRVDDFVRKGTEGPWVRAETVKGIFEDTPKRAGAPLKEPPALPLSGVNGGTQPSARPTPPIPPIPIRTHQPSSISTSTNSVQLARWRAQRNRAKTRRRVLLLGVSLVAVIFAGLFLASRPAKPPSSGEAEPTRIVKPSADGPSSSDLEIDLSFESDPRRKIPDGGVSGDSPATATAADRLAGEQTDSKDREPTDASTRKPAVLSGVEITVDSVLLGPPRLERAPGRFARPSDSYLIVNLSLKSADDARRLEYNGWSNFRDTSLVDDLDNAYPLKRFRVANIVGQVDRTGVYSDAPATDVLVFERPVSKARRLFLKLPGIALGSRGLVEFMIPVSMIQEFSTDDDAGGGGTADAAAPAFDPDADPDGDVSKIMADIDAIGGGDGSDAAPLEFGEEEDRAAVRRPED